MQPTQPTSWYGKDAARFISGVAILLMIAHAPRRQLDSIVQGGGNRDRAVRCRIRQNMRVAVCIQLRLRVVDPKCRLYFKKEMLAPA